MLCNSCVIFFRRLQAAEQRHREVEQQMSGLRHEIYRLTADEDKSKKPNLHTDSCRRQKMVELEKSTHEQHA